MKLWLEDLRYFAACDFFNGRTAPDYKKISAFAPKGGNGEPEKR
jgi:hypothetical protein